MSEDQGRIDMKRATELLFSDSSKNFSDLKSRQWTATNLSVVAIMALAALANKTTVRHWVAIMLMLLVVVCHEIVTLKCGTNLDVFRVRIKKLIECHFPEESHKLFNEKFEDALVDEGRITWILVLSTPVTFGLALFVVWPSWSSFLADVSCLCSR